MKYLCFTLLVLAQSVFAQEVTKIHQDISQEDLLRMQLFSVDAQIDRASERFQERTDEKAKEDYHEKLKMIRLIVLKVEERTLSHILSKKNPDSRDNRLLPYLHNRASSGYYDNAKDVYLSSEQIVQWLKNESNQLSKAFDEPVPQVVSVTTPNASISADLKAIDFPVRATPTKVVSNQEVGVPMSRSRDSRVLLASLSILVVIGLCFFFLRR